MRTTCFQILFPALFLAGMKVPSIAAQTPAPSSTPVVHPVYPTDSTSPLGAQITALLADPTVSRAHWGIAVTTLDGTPIWGLEESKFFRPASNAKLYTTAAALAMLGPGKHFTTSVVARGKLSHGTLHGDLELRGGGDANFAAGYDIPYIAPALRPKNPPPPTPLADFDALAAQVAAKGITKIEGDIVGNDTYFENTPYPEGWSTDDLLWGYGAPVSALTVHDNQLDLTITDTGAPGKASEKATITLSPDVPFYTVNQPVLGQQALAVYNQDFGKNAVSIKREPNSRNFLITGDVVAKHGPEKDQLAIDQPAEFAAAALKQALEKHGITITGTVRASHWDSGFIGSFYAASHEAVPFANSPNFFTPNPITCMAQRVYTGPEPEEQTVAEKTSPTFADDLKLTLKDSQNLHAEIMLRNIAAEKDCEHTLRKGLALMRAYWTVKAGLDGDDFQFYDGSGLSTKDLVTPRTTAQVLAFAATQAWFPVWKDALPVGGMDGSLRSRFAAAPLKGHVFAKTGTLGESRALSGYVDTASGHQVIFSIMVDDHAPGSADRPIMDKIVAAIAANN